MGQSASLSIVLPAKNEAEGLQRTLPELRQRFPEAQIIVVDDGSTDDTGSLAAARGASTSLRCDEPVERCIRFTGLSVERCMRFTGLSGALGHTIASNKPLCT